MKKYLIAVLLLLSAYGCKKEVAPAAGNMISASDHSGIVRKIDTNFATQAQMLAFSHKMDTGIKTITVTVVKKSPAVITNPITYTFHDLLTFDFTFFFDEPWPWINYKLTLRITISGSGQVVSCVPITGVWGVGIFGSYVDDPSYAQATIVGNNIVFTAQGTETTALGFGGIYAQTNVQTMQYDGWVAVNPNGSVTSGQGRVVPKNPN